MLHWAAFGLPLVFAVPGNPRFDSRFTLVLSLVLTLVLALLSVALLCVLCAPACFSALLRASVRSCAAPRAPVHFCVACFWLVASCDLVLGPAGLFFCCCPLASGSLSCYCGLLSTLLFSLLLLSCFFQLAAWGCFSLCSPVLCGALLGSPDPLWLASLVLDPR